MSLPVLPESRTRSDNDTVLNQLLRRGYLEHPFYGYINDILAMRAADLGVLSIQQTGKCPKLLCEEADVVIRDIKEIIGIVEKLANP